MSTQHTVCITGAAGYVGAMLCEQFAKRDDIVRIVAIDKEEQPAALQKIEKITWITANTSDKDAWWGALETAQPDVVVHTAWHIREMYGRQHIEWKWNVDGSRAIFDFVFAHPTVKRLVYFSTAAVYGAYKENTIEHRFTEDEPMREEEYSYAREKIKVEEILKEVYAEALEKGGVTPIVSIVRPAAITGPRGRFMRIRFGLQSALSGKLKGNFFYRLVSLMVSYVPATPWWVRQFIHEDDVTDIVALLAFDGKISHQYEVFNIAPPGEPVLAPQMAESVGKKVLPVKPWMVRIAFFIFWHISRGKIPNGRGVWRFYSYPIVLDGSKLTSVYDYHYQHDSRNAFGKTAGRYEYAVPEAERRA